ALPIARACLQVIILELAGGELVGPFLGARGPYGGAGGGFRANFSAPAVVGTPQIFDLRLVNLGARLGGPWRGDRGGLTSCCGRRLHCNNGTEWSPSGRASGR